jgi:hypothetical protein
VLTSETPDVRLINATEGGARIEGFEELTLSDLLATLPELDITAESLARDATCAQAPLSRKRLGDWCVEQSALTRKVRHAARRIRRLGETALLALDRNDGQKTQRCFEKLDIAELALKEAVARMPFVDCWTHADVRRVLEANGHSASVRDDHDSARRAVSLELSLAGVIEDGASEIEQQLRELSKRFADDEPRADASSSAQRSRT